MRTYTVVSHALIIAAASGCMCENKMMVGAADKGDLQKWHRYLKVTVAEPGVPLGTTQTQISNVSPAMAAAKMYQALESYDGKLEFAGASKDAKDDAHAGEFRLSTVYQISTKDEAEGEVRGPAVTDVVVGGHYYYIAPLDYPSGEVNLAAYVSTGKKIPGVAVVDAEDETKPAWIRTADADGNPYAITLYLGTQSAGHDDHNIYRFLRNRGYSTAVSCNRISNPTMEFDEKWRPYWTVTYERDDGCAEAGEMYYPMELLVVDAQTEELKSYALDDPNTTDKDERAEDIPEWVDQIYSPQIVLAWINAWGYNVDNYGKTSQLNELHVDRSVIDQTMNAANTNLVFVAYITSTQKDDSMVGVMLVDPRTGQGTFHKTQGPMNAMAIKSAAHNAIVQATALYGYGVEDLTLHTIYGELAWEGVLTRPSDNGSLYAGTVLLRADDDLKPANVVHALNKHEAFTRYEEARYLTRTTRVGSNVLVDEEIEGVVSDVRPIVMDGNTSFLVRLQGKPEQVWEVRIPYIGDPNTEDVLSLEAGDAAFLRYGDPKNRRTYLVKEITRKKAAATQTEPAKNAGSPLEKKTEK